MTETFNEIEEFNDGHGRPGKVYRWKYWGRECKIVKNPIGHYCGYVKTLIGDELNHPSDRLYEIYKIAEVHGGITYGPDNDGWIGFDTGHAGDVNLDENGEQWGDVPPIGEDRVWTLEKVRKETEDFAENIIEEEDRVRGLPINRCEIHGSFFVYNDSEEEWFCPFCYTDES